MGLFCELYRIDNATIDKIVNDPKWGYDFIVHNYAEFGGLFHIDNDTIFSMDKAWAIAGYLITKYAKSRGCEVNVLGDKIKPDDTGLAGLRLIRPPEVYRVNELIRHIDTSTISDFYDRDDTIRNGLYRADWIEEVDDYVISHVVTINKAYAKAASENDGLVVRIG